MKKQVVILDNIRSLYNVGAIFRTCEAVGINKIYLCGITGHPNQSIRIKKKINKTALGTIENLKWKYYKYSKNLISKLQRNNFKLISIEQTAKSINFAKYKFCKNNENTRIAFVFGNEIQGLQNIWLENSDEILKIPMKGKAKSLNVATCVGIILYNFKSNH